MFVVEKRVLHAVFDVDFCFATENVKHSTREFITYLRFGIQQLILL